MSYWDDLRKTYEKYKCFHVNFFPQNKPDPKKVPLLAGLDDSGSTSVLTYADIKKS
jgi:hypothetical protein